jgi:hypothetical protein
MMGDWYAYKPGDTDAHAVGSEVFKRLYDNYGCTLDCEERIFKALVAGFATKTSISNTEARQTMETVVGTSLTSLFQDLGLY